MMISISRWCRDLLATFALMSLAASVGAWGLLQCLLLTPDAPPGRLWWFLSHLFAVVGVAALNAAQGLRVWAAHPGGGPPTEGAMAKQPRLARWIGEQRRAYVQAQPLALDQHAFAHGREALLDLEQDLAKWGAARDTPGPTVAHCARVVRDALMQDWSGPMPFLRPFPLDLAMEVLRGRPVANVWMGAGPLAAMAAWARLQPVATWAGLGVAGASSIAARRAILEGVSYELYVILAIAGAVAAALAARRFPGLTSRVDRLDGRWFDVRRAVALAQRHHARVSRGIGTTAEARASMHEILSATVQLEDVGPFGPGVGG